MINRKVFCKSGPRVISYGQSNTVEQSVFSISSNSLPARWLVQAALFQEQEALLPRRAMSVKILSTAEELEGCSWPTCSKQPRLVDCRIGVVNKLDRRRRRRVAPSAHCAVSVKNGRVSVHPSVCPIDRQQQRRAADLLLRSGAGSRYRSYSCHWQAGRVNFGPTVRRSDILVPYGPQCYIGQCAESERAVEILPCRSVGSSTQCYGRHGPVIESGPAYESRRLNHRLTCSEFYDPETSTPSEACQWRRQQTRVMPNSHHLFVSRPLRRCELDFRQLKTVADRNFEVWTR